jgi:lysine 6-dehydrogenase
MKYVIIGAGKMGKAIAYLLAKRNDLAEILLIDYSQKILSKAVKEINCPNQIKTYAIDMNSLWGKEKFEKLIEDEKPDVLISAADYSINYYLTRVAIKYFVDMVDLGGNNDIANQQLAHDDEALNKEVIIISNCGLAPGFANWVAANAIYKFTREFNKYPENVKIYVGGLPQNPQPPFNYKLVFSVKGLINEYIEPCKILRNYKVVDNYSSLTEIETVFAPFKLEAFHTSGGSSNLPNIFEDKIKNLEYKTLRYEGHCNIFRALKDMNLLDNSIIEKRIIEKQLEKLLTNDDKDLVIMRVEIQDGDYTIRYNMHDVYNSKLNHSAMARTTAYPTAIVAEQIANGMINKFGVLKSEEVIVGRVYDYLIEELEKEGIKIETYEIGTVKT